MATPEKEKCSQDSPPRSPEKEFGETQTLSPPPRYEDIHPPGVYFPSLSAMQAASIGEPTGSPDKLAEVNSDKTNGQLKPQAQVAPPSRSPLVVDAPKVTLNIRGTCDDDIEYISNLTDAKIALSDYLHNQRLFKRKRIDEMTIVHIRPMHAYTYKIQTFTDNRGLEESFQPFDHSYVDGQLSSGPPSRWDVALEPKEDFKNGKFKMDLPQSAIVKPCKHCGGVGRNSCGRCKGVAILKCVGCNGGGKISVFAETANKEIIEVAQDCPRCAGSGRTNCNGNGCRMGQVQCEVCCSQGKLKFWMVLHVEYTNDVEFFVTRREILKPKHFNKVTGIPKVDQTITNGADNLVPIAYKFDKEISSVANRCVQAQLERVGNTRKILKIRQQVTMIPVVRVHYKSEKTGAYGYFFIYGNERRVRFPAECRYSFSESKCSIS